MWSEFQVYFILRGGWKHEESIMLMNAFWEEDRHPIIFRGAKPGKPWIDEELLRPDDAMQYIMDGKEGWCLLFIRGANGGLHEFDLRLAGKASEAVRKDLWIVSRDYYTFFKAEDNPSGHNERKLVRILKKAYKDIHPYHMYMDMGEFPNIYFGNPRNPWTGDRENRKKYLLNRVNIFSPEIVERLGRERLLGIDAHILETLDDGGIFIVPCPLSDDSDDCMMSGKFHVPVDKETEEWYWKLYIPGEG